MPLSVCRALPSFQTPQGPRETGLRGRNGRQGARQGGHAPWWRFKRAARAGSRRLSERCFRRADARPGKGLRLSSSDPKPKHRAGGSSYPTWIRTGESPGLPAALERSLRLQLSGTLHMHGGKELSFPWGGAVWGRAHPWTAAKDGWTQSGACLAAKEAQGGCKAEASAQDPGSWGIPQRSRGWDGGGGTKEAPSMRSRKEGCREAPASKGCSPDAWIARWAGQLGAF